MKKFLLTCAAFLLCAGMSMAQTELFDIENITIDTWGDKTAPETMTDTDQGTISIRIFGADGFQWGNQVKITMSNVAGSGLDLDKQYRLQFTAIAGTDDCGGVTLKMFNNNESGKEMVYENQSLAFSTTPYDFDSGWISPSKADVDGMIVFAFGWDPAQEIVLSNISFLEKDGTTNVNEASASSPSVYKVIENGEILIVTPQGKYTLLGIKK